MPKFWSREWGAFPQPEYFAWHNMIRRCRDPRDRSFERYGGRGIRVCDRWRDDFMAFLSDMGPRPTAAYSLDRINNNGPYTPENCRWATKPQQGQNHLGSFGTRTEARFAYRRAARRQRIISEISAAWAREAAAVAQGVADRYDGALDRQLLDLLIHASRPPGVAGHGARRKDAARPGDQREPTKSRGAGRSRIAIDRSKQDGVDAVLSGVNRGKRT
jgi:hypothetical protein